LAGSWWAHLLFLGDIIDPKRRQRALKSIYANNVAPVAGCPADETTPDGKKMQSMASVSMAYFNAHAIYAGLPDLGWEAVEKVYRARYDLDGCPWDATLQWSGKDNLEPQWGRWYMSHPSSWYLLLALGGVRVDRLRNKLSVTPNWPSDWSDNLIVPIYLPGLKAELKAKRGHSDWSITFKLKQTPIQTIVFDSIHSRLPDGIDPSRVRARINWIDDVPVQLEQGGELQIQERLRLDKENDGFSFFVV
jgi:hypothetical protein